MTVQLAIALAAFFVEHKNFLATEVTINLCLDLGTVNCRSTYCYRTLVVNEKHLVKLKLITFFCVLDRVDEQFLSFLDTELLTLNFNDSVHYYVCFKNYRGGGVMSLIVIIATYGLFAKQGTKI